ncbi:hypothetical protein HK101_009989 [Irineochytrium annulatum]|nr:hypothetical protein HK101_009989 [Irineochytrium annulatum]
MSSTAPNADADVTLPASSAAPSKLDKGKGKELATEVEEPAEQEEPPTWESMPRADQLALAVNHTSEGRKALALGEYEKAVSELGEASAILAFVHGDQAPECADVLFMYGTALFNNAVSKSSPLGGVAVTTGETAGAGAEQDGADAKKASTVVPLVDGVSTQKAVETVLEGLMNLPAKASSRFVFSGDGAEDSTDAGADDSDEGGEGEDGEENPDGAPDESDPIEEDIQIAWETLDLARIIYESQSNAARSRVAEVLLVLGDVSLEQGHWEKAVSDFSRAVDIKRELLGDAHRQLSEALYKLGLAFEFSKEFGNALSATKDVVAVLERKREELKKVAAAGGEGKKAAEEELADIDSLMPDIYAKIEEIEAELREAEAEKMKTETLQSTLAGAQSSSSGRIQDISNLVKKKKKDDTEDVKAAGKRKPEEAFLEDASKRTKLENGNGESS